MKIGRCPGCGAKEFYSREVDAIGGYGPDLLPGTGCLLRHGKFRLYVCGQCGRVTWYVPQRFLVDIKERGKFQRARLDEDQGT